MSSLVGKISNILRKLATNRIVVLFYWWQCRWLIGQAHRAHCGSHGNLPWAWF